MKAIIGRPLCRTAGEDRERDQERQGEYSQHTAPLHIGAFVGLEGRTRAAFPFLCPVPFLNVQLLFGGRNTLRPNLSVHSHPGREQPQGDKTWFLGDEKSLNNHNGLCDLPRATVYKQIYSISMLLKFPGGGSN